jgi:hypothetical protein
MKQCRICGVVKLLEEFPSKHKKIGASLRSYCYECQRNYCRQYYIKNKPEYNRRRRVVQRAMRDRNRMLVHEYLLEHRCVDCGERDVRVLEFDHVRGKKLGNISELAGGAVAWRRIEEELAKCEVRCANCHRRRTGKVLGWFRWRDGA